MSATPEPTAPTRPIENVQRGTILALVIIPVGIVAWVIVWEIGFIVSILGLGIAFGAMALYRFGSGGLISRTGAIRVAIITVVTLLLAIFAGFVVDVLAAYTSHFGVNPVEALTTPDFWRIFGAIITDPSSIGSNALSLLLALVFGALGCFSVLRTAFRQTAAANANAAYVAQPYTIAPPTTPETPAAPTIAEAPAVPPAPDATSDSDPKTN